MPTGGTVPPDEPGARSPARASPFLSRLVWLAPVWAVGIDLIAETWFECDGPFGMSAPTVESLARALAMGGMLVIIHLAFACPPDIAGGKGGGRWRPRSVLGRRLRPVREITLGGALLIGAVLVLAVWHASVRGYERGLDRVERGACPAAEAPARDR